MSHLTFNMMSPYLGSMPKPNPTQEYASLLLKRPFHDWLAEQRADGTGWDMVSKSLYAATGGKIAVTGITLKRWSSAAEAKVAA